MEQKCLIPIFIVVILALFIIKEKIEKSEFSDVNETQEKNDQLKEAIKAELKQIHSDVQNLKESLRSEETFYNENFDDGRNISTDLEKLWNITE